MRRRRDRDRAAGRTVQANAPGAIAAGGNVVNAQTHIGELHVHESPLSPGEVEYTAAALQRMAQTQWKDEAKLRSLGDPDPIPVLWRPRPSLSDDASTIDGGGDWAADWGDLSSGDVAELAARFRGTRRRRLVIVGGPGSGKTTLAVLLLLELLDTRQAIDVQRAGRPALEPVPILLPIAGWDAQRFPRLQDWLLDQLPRYYPALRSVEHAPVLGELVDGGHVLPVLDGLDELPVATRSAVIVALNRSLRDGDQLILTSRTAEFRDATKAAVTVIGSSVVLQARALSPETAVDYLRRLPPIQVARWRRVLDGLREAPLPGSADVGWKTSVAATTTTPLGLWLLRTVYTAPGADPDELADDARFARPAQLRSHLLDSLVPAVIAARPPSADPARPFQPRRKRDPDETRRYLAFLAKTLTQPSLLTRLPRTRDLAWWRLAEETIDRPLWGFTAFFGLLFTGTLGGLAGLGAETIFGSPFGIVGWIVGGLYGVFVGALLGGAVGEELMADSDKRIGLWQWLDDEPGFADYRLRGRGWKLLEDVLDELVRRLVPRLITLPTTVLVFWSVCRLLSWDTSWLLVALKAFLVGVPAFALVSGFTAWLESPVSDTSASTPRSTLRADRTLHLTRAGLFGTVTGLVVFVVYGPLGLALGVLVGLESGFLLYGGHAWLVYKITTRRLARRGELPRDLMGFLDDTHRLGLLRTVGPIYQFRHAELQDHFARFQPEPSCAASSLDGARAAASPPRLRRP